jgi:hypothetical protein
LLLRDLPLQEISHEVVVLGHNASVIHQSAEFWQGMPLFFDLKNLQLNLPGRTIHRLGDHGQKRKSRLMEELGSLDSELHDFVRLRVPACLIEGRFEFNDNLASRL